MKICGNMEQIIEKPIVESKETTDLLNDLVVYNDSVNTFQNVIIALMEICRHTMEQAEQCTTIIHYKGKCSVKKGTIDDLLMYRTAFCDRGISAEIE